MIPTFSVDMRAFNATLRRAVIESERAAPRVINGHAMGVALKAVELTEKADADKIAHILGQTGTQLNYIKSGKRLRVGQRARGGSLGGEDSFAARIVNARRREIAGPDFMLWGHALEDAAGKLIDARRRATAFIKSGWLWAIRDLAQVVPGFARNKTGKDAKASGARKGGAMPARSTGGIFGSGKFKATIENSALITSGGKFQASGSHNPSAVASRGLQSAINAEQQNMEQHLRTGMTDAMKKAGVL